MPTTPDWVERVADQIEKKSTAVQTTATVASWWSGVGEVVAGLAGAGANTVAMAIRVGDDLAHGNVDRAGQDIGGGAANTALALIPGKDFIANHTGIRKAMHRDGDDPHWTAAQVAAQRVREKLGADGHTVDSGIVDNKSGLPDRAPGGVQMPSDRGITG